MHISLITTCLLNIVDRREGSSVLFFVLKTINTDTPGLPNNCQFAVSKSHPHLHWIGGFRAPASLPRPVRGSALPAAAVKYYYLNYQTISLVVSYHYYHYY